MIQTIWLQTTQVQLKTTQTRLRLNADSPKQFSLIRKTGNYLNSILLKPLNLATQFL